jgi:hypothetical protein
MGGVQLGPLSTAATNRLIVPAPGDYDDGEIGGMIGRGNRSTGRKPASLPLWPPQTPHDVQDSNTGRRGGKPTTNRLGHSRLWQFADVTVPVRKMKIMPIITQQKPILL